jgi:Uma2 family endonuclease
MAESISPRRRITVDEYYDMARTGQIAPDERTELIEGEVIHVAPIGDRHGGAVEHLDTLLHRVLGSRATVRCQMPVSLGEYSHPEPDLVVMRPRAGRNDRAHPSITDVFLIVEISDSTLRYDLDVKVPLYARHGATEVWIVDLKNNQFRSYRSPSNGRYQVATSTANPGKTFIPGVPGVTVDLSELLADPESTGR